MADLNALQPVASINSYIELANNAGAGVVNPEVFYQKQLLDTIRIDGAQYIYHSLATESPIQEKADKLMVRRWAPLQAHTTPLAEGVPPMSDKGSVEKYEMSATSYGRYMEFTDKVDFAVVDPVIAHYSAEYSLVALETLDMLARDELLSKAQKKFAGGAANITEMRIATGKPLLSDLRLIVLSLKRQLVKPRSGVNYTVVVSPEFVFDMLDDPYIQKYMTINQTTKGMMDDIDTLIPLFNMEFKETMVCPDSSRFVNIDGKKSIIIYKEAEVADETEDWYDTLDDSGYVYRVLTEDDLQADGTTPVYELVSGYVKDGRTGQDASYIPNQDVWTLPDGWNELKIHHILMVGKDALTRTGLAGEQNAKMYVKPLGSAGVLDPIDQRQSIGFKINSVGYGSTRLEAIVDYMCIPTQANL
jgi:hypothetical protein